MGRPEKGTPERERYRVVQYRYRKSHYMKFYAELKYGEDDDLIYNLSHFEGNRNAWIKSVLREALEESGRDRYVPDEAGRREAPDVSDLDDRVRQYDDCLHRKRR